MKILVVDDEPYLAASLAPAFRAADSVRAVTDGQEAFKILTEEPEPFDLVVVDHMMPGWSGPELIKRLQLARFPGRYMVITGFISPKVTAVYRSMGVDHVVPKPVDFGELRLALKEIEESVQSAETRRRMGNMAKRHEGGPGGS